MPIYDVGQNFGARGLDGGGPGGSHHRERGTSAYFDDDRLFADHDVVEQALEVDAPSRVIIRGERPDAAVCPGKFEEASAVDAHPVLESGRCLRLVQIRRNSEQRPQLGQSLGLVDASQRGVWTLTEAGRAAALDADAVLALFKAVHKQLPRKDTAEPSGATQANDDEEESEAPEPEAEDYRAKLLALLRSLPPAGFERICQRLLRENGFQQVVVTGRAGDGGIDGHGVLEINPLVTSCSTSSMPSADSAPRRTTPAKFVAF